MTGKSRKLGRAVFLNCIVFALLITLSAGVMAFSIYYNNAISQYQSYLRTMLELSVGELDIAELEKCLESGEASEKYLQMQKSLDALMDAGDAIFVYAVRPMNLEATDNMQYIIEGMDRTEKELYGAEDPGELSGEEFSVDVVQSFQRQMEEPDQITFFRDETLYGYLYTGMMTLTDEEGQPFCVLAVDVSIDRIRQGFYSFVGYLALGCGLLALLFILGQLHWMKRRVTDPVKAIASSARELAQMAASAEKAEELNFAPPAVSVNDEIRNLADALTEMSQNMKGYMRRLMTETLEKQRMASELDMAKRIQEGCLPSIFPAFPERTEFDLYALMDPAKEVGGDFYDFFFVDQDHLALVIADVSGKGVPAALYMMIAKLLLKNRTQGAEGPDKVLENINDQLCESTEVEMFVTVWLGVVELSTGKVTAANAGHECPVIRRAGGKYEVFKDRHGLVLGGMKGVPYREYELELHPGDTLFLYTDGVTEATDTREQLYGRDRMLAVLNGDPGAGCRKQIENVRRDIHSFVGDAPQFDDITMVSFRLREGDRS